MVPVPSGAPPTHTQNNYCDVDALRLSFRPATAVRILRALMDCWCPSFPSASPTLSPGRPLHLRRQNAPLRGEQHERQPDRGFPLRVLVHLQR